MSKLWFKRKSYGWGWTPSTWEGWVVIAIYAVAAVKVFILMDVSSHSGSDTLIAFFVPYICLTLILILICYLKGEKPRWQWGKKGIDKSV